MQILKKVLFNHCQIRNRVVWGTVDLWNFESEKKINEKDIFDM
jgi:hypothetical protein